MELVLVEDVQEVLAQALEPALEPTETVKAEATE